MSDDNETTSEEVTTRDTTEIQYRTFSPARTDDLIDMDNPRMRHGLTSDTPVEPSFGLEVLHLAIDKRSTAQDLAVDVGSRSCALASRRFLAHTSLAMVRSALFRLLVPLCLRDGRFPGLNAEAGDGLSLRRV